MTLETLISLPGMGCELRMTVSWSSSCSQRLSPEAMQRERGHRLALGAGGDHAHLTRLEGVDLLDVDEAGLGDREQTHLAGDAHVLLHRASERGDHPAVGDGGVGDLLHPVDVAGEAGRDHPATGAGRRTAGAARRRRTSPSASGRAESALVESLRQQADALVLGDRAHHRRAPVSRPSTGVRSILKSPVCRIVPCGVWMAVANPCGHRVGDGDELAIERADLAAFAVGDGDELGAVGQPGLLDAACRRGRSVSAEP